MRTDDSTAAATRDRFPEARARRMAREVEAVCRRNVAGCRVSAAPSEDGSSFDLAVGLGDSSAAERVVARGLDAAALESEETLEKLAGFLTVWIEPDSAEEEPREARQASGKPGIMAPVRCRGTRESWQSNRAASGAASAAIGRWPT